MTSAAANSAAKILGGSSRNRPSRSMSQQGSNSDAPTNNQSGPPNSSQFESLSERLLRENESSGAPGSGNGPNGGGGPDGRKVRFSETAALASTLDAANANPNDDDNDNDPNNSNRPQRSPLDVISDLFQNNKYALPTFLVMAAGIFALVHLAGGPTSADDGLKRYSPQTTSTGTGREGPNQQQLNVGGPDGDFGDIIFSLSPTIATGVGGGASMAPTSEAGIHMTPKIAPVTSPSEQTGNQPGWIVVPTSSGEFEHAKGDQTTLKWNYPEGAPTPDPALLYDADGGSQVGLKWNYPEGGMLSSLLLLVFEFNE